MVSALSSVFSKISPKSHLKLTMKSSSLAENRRCLPPSPEIDDVFLPRWKLTATAPFVDPRCQQGSCRGTLLAARQHNDMLPDFVLCIGDDRSDEDMFEVIMNARTGPSLSPVAEVFACTVGQKPSKAKYYLDDTSEILRMLQGLAEVSEQAACASHASQRSVIDRE